MKLKKIPATMLLVILIGWGCKKTSNQPPLVLLTTHKWYPQTVIQNGQQVSIPLCEKNSFLVFQNNDSGWVDESACNVNSIMQPFTFSLSGDHQSILLNDFFNIGSYSWNIINLNSKNLEIRLSVPITSGPQPNTALTIDYTFVSK